MSDRKCVLCGNDILVDHKSKYCSKRCSKIGARVDWSLPPSICKTCGKEFRPRNDQKGLYCSYVCCRTAPMAKCINCGKNFRITANRTESAKYCSFACLSEYAEKQRVTKICPYCHSEFKASNSKKIYCSNICRRKHKRESSPKNKICIICGKSYVTPLQDPSESKYCSRECQAIGLSNTTESSCLYCGTSFSVPLSAKHQKYCSRRCYLLSGMKKSHHKSVSLTEPEMICRDNLIRRGLKEGVDFIIEHPFGRMSFDFYFVDLMVDLEVDGSYWHKGKVNYDAVRDMKVVSNGIRVVRVSEREMQENADWAIEAKLLPVLKERYKAQIQAVS